MKTYMFSSGKQKPESEEHSSKLFPIFFVVGHDQTKRLLKSSLQTSASGQEQDAKIIVEVHGKVLLWSCLLNNVCGFRNLW